MRVRVYVDGFNLYYRALKDTPYKWLNLVELSKRLLSPGDDIDLIRYFTARISPRAGDPDAPKRQQIYFSALKTIPNIEFHYGSFLAKTKWRPLVSDSKKYVEIHDTEEKGSDVNLAIHLLNDGWYKRYDLALVLSQDTDLIEPLKMVRIDVGKKVGLIWLDGKKPNKKMADACSFVRHISPSDLAAAQFPNPIVRSDNTEIHKPATW
jgi:hypothetical protein